MHFGCFSAENWSKNWRKLKKNPKSLQRVMLKIDQWSAKNLENKPKNITTNNGELRLNMLPGSKSG